MEILNYKGNLFLIEGFTFEQIECPKEIKTDIKLLTELIEFLNY